MELEYKESHRNERNRFLSEFSFVRRFREKGHTRQHELLVDAVADAWYMLQERLGDRCSYWHRIGCLLGGVLGAGYIYWIRNRVEQLGADRVMFIARDGYSLQKIYAAFFKAENTSYVYAPRSVAVSTDACVIENYRKYVESLQLRGKCSVIVDSGTINFTSEKLLSQTSGVNVRGLFVIDYSADGLGDAWFHSPNFTQRWPNLMELLFMAPTPPVVAVDKNGPVYLENIPACERRRIEIYPDISEAEVDAALELLRRNIVISRELWLDWIDSFIECMTEEDRRHINGLSHYGDIKHQNAVKIITDPKRPEWFWTRRWRLFYFRVHYFRRGLQMVQKYWLYGCIPWKTVTEDL